METDWEYLYNIIMIGDSGVGKTSILMQYKDGKFASTGSPTTGMEWMNKTHVIDGILVKLQVWDTGGQERFRAVTREYYRRADAVVLVYDISDAKTFRHLSYWVEEVKKYAKEDVYCLLVGNKSDLRDKNNKKKSSSLLKKATMESGKEESKATMESQAEENMVTTESGKQFAKKNCMPFVESTATDWDNIYKLFEGLAKKLIEKQLPTCEEKNDKGTISLKLDDKEQEKHDIKCC